MSTEIAQSPASVSNNNQLNMGVKYRLVEAEEVSTTPAPVQSRKKKGKTNWTQFPIDTTIEDSENQKPDHHNNRNYRQHRGRGRGGRYRGGRTKKNNDGHGSYYNGVFIPRNDPNVTAEMAKCQIEYYFSAENLVRDTFLRQHMDEEGYVPVPFVASFHSVFAIHQDYESLLSTLGNSGLLELDLKNEKIRVKEGWKQWLWPNSNGGFGVPLYIKPSEGFIPNNEPTNEESN